MGSSLTKHEWESTSLKHWLRKGTKIAPHPYRVCTPAAKTAPQDCSCSSSWCTKTMLRLHLDTEPGQAEHAVAGAARGCFWVRSVSSPPLKPAPLPASYDSCAGFALGPNPSCYVTAKWLQCCTRHRPPLTSPQDNRDENQLKKVSLLGSLMTPCFGGGIILLNINALSPRFLTYYVHTLQFLPNMLAWNNLHLLIWQLLTFPSPRSLFQMAAL